MNDPGDQTDSVYESEYITRIAIRDAGRVCFLETMEVDWMQASGNYVEIHAGGRSYLQRETMKSLDGKLSPRQFARVHRATIVNIDRIKELRTAVPENCFAWFSISIERGSQVVKDVRRKLAVLDQAEIL